MCVAIDLVWQIQINFQTVSESHFREVVVLFVSFSPFHYVSPNRVMRQWLLSLPFLCLSMLNAKCKSVLNVCNPLKQEVFWEDFIFLGCKLALPLSLEFSSMCSVKKCVPQLTLRVSPELVKLYFLACFTERQLIRFRTTLKKHPINASRYDFSSWPNWREEQMWQFQNFRLMLLQKP